MMKEGISRKGIIIIKTAEKVTWIYILLTLFDIILIEESFAYVYKCNVKHLNYFIHVYRH